MKMLHLKKIDIFKIKNFFKTLLAGRRVLASAREREEY